jgi:hypothetical protein
MSTTTDTAADLDDRDIRALAEPMIVDADDPELHNDDEAFVYSEDRRYVVNLAAPYCDCKDQHYRTPSGGCKHLRRARFALGERSIPEWADRDRLDGQLRQRLGDDA